MTGTTHAATDGHRAANDRVERDRGDSGSAEQDPLQATAHATGQFVWDHLPSVVLVSVAWFLASLPVVTVGPASIGAYRAVLSLRAGDGLDGDALQATVRSQFVHATLLGLFPLVLVGISVHYALAYLTTGAVVAGALAVAGTYVALYATLVLVPAFIAMAGGADVTSALWDGYRWTARNAVETIVLGTVTVALLAVATLGTVAVVLLFAGVACAFHVEFVTGIDESTIRSEL